ncbi:hypothetical protein WAI453_004781 [Rhynchosporium graminicola]
MQLRPHFQPSQLGHSLPINNSNSLWSCPGGIAPRISGLILTLYSFPKQTVSFLAVNTLCDCETEQSKFGLNVHDSLIIRTKLVSGYKMLNRRIIPISILQS